MLSLALFWLWPNSLEEVLRERIDDCFAPLKASQAPTSIEALFKADEVSKCFDDTFEVDYHSEEFNLERSVKRAELKTGLASGAPRYSFVNFGISRFSVKMDGDLVQTDLFVIVDWKELDIDESLRAAEQIRLIWRKDKVWVIKSVHTSARSTL